MKNMTRALTTRIVNNKLFIDGDYCLIEELATLIDPTIILTHDNILYYGDGEASFDIIKNGNDIYLKMIKFDIFKNSPMN